jgi:hypothetical protein
MAVVENNVEAARQWDDELVEPEVGVAAAFSAGRHVVQVVNAANFEGNVRAAFDEGEIAARIGDARQLQQPAATKLTVSALAPWRARLAMHFRAEIQV